MRTPIGPPSAYTLGLEMRRAAHLDAGGRKQLTTTVAQWLTSQPDKEASIRIGAATLEVMAFGGKHVQLIPMEPAHTFEAPSSVAENFREKTKKYAPLGLFHWNELANKAYLFLNG